MLSHLLTHITERGFEITYSTPKSSDLSLFTLGERAYDHLLLLPSKSKGLGPALTPQLLLQFLNADGNILLTLSTERPTPSGIISLLLELDIHIPSDKSTVVVDHFNYDTVSAAEKHDVVLLPRPGQLRPDVINLFGGVMGNKDVIAVPAAVPQLLGNDSPLLAPILRAPRTAYSYSRKEEALVSEDPYGTGSQLNIVSSMQARNSARFTVLGSAEMLEDAWFEAEVQGPSGTKSKTANREFAREVSAWTFKELGVLKVGSINHWLDEGAEDRVQNASSLNPKIYRVKNTVVCPYPTPLSPSPQGTNTDVPRHTKSSSQPTPTTATPPSLPPPPTPSS